MTSLVLGLGESGLAMARWLAREGEPVRVADSRMSPPGAGELARLVPGAELISGPFTHSLLEGVTRVALSPGLSRREAIVQAALGRAIPVAGEFELFAQGLARHGMDRAKLIAITGTNGKTTVTSMVGALCRAAGLETAVAGNISPSVLSALMSCLDMDRRPQAWALELSSFQLESAGSFAAHAATVLNVSDDHLDRYDGLADYAAAKAAIFAGGGVQVLNRQDPRVMAMRVPGRRVMTFGLDAPAGSDDFGLVAADRERWLAEGSTCWMRASELPLAGDHNLANALAAFALCRAVDLPGEALVRGLKTFQGLPHRVERVAFIGGVDYFDDSKGTNVGATVAALVGLGRPVVLIAGGDGKQQDFSPLAPAVAAHCRAVVLIGRDGPAIGRVLAETGVPLMPGRDMDQAVRMAASAALPGDAVLLSPACASFDMFRNYAHRAEVFVAAVRSLEPSR